jgi:hypothetical protein
LGDETESRREEFQALGLFEGGLWQQDYQALASELAYAFGKIVPD